MREKMLSLFVGVCALVAVTAAADDFKAVGDHVNLRARPSLQAEVVGQASSGELLTVTIRTNQWAGVVPPKRIGVWIFSAHVQNGVVAVPKLIVRAGAGLAYSEVGILKKGEKVKARQTMADWTQIDPPATCTLWVDSKLLAPVTLPAMPAVSTNEPAVPVSTGVSAVASAPAATPLLTNAPAVLPAMPEVQPPEKTAEPTAVMPVASGAIASVATNAPDAPADLVERGLIPVQGQGQLVRAEGTVRTAGYLLSPPGRYRLVDQTDRAYVTICYLNGDNDKFSSLVGRRVAVLGRQYWLRGERSPVIAVAEITPK